MLQKYNTNRTLADNLRLGALTSFVAGMVNVSSVMIFFAFTSNITGHFAVLAEEVSKGNWYQVGIVFCWIFLFFSGSFLANFCVIHLSKKHQLLAHSLPLVLEIACLMIVGVYGQLWYSETLTETEILLCFMLFAMGLQNGLTASVSNSAIKTTHLTGLTTDLAILFSMFTKAEYRENKELHGKMRLLLTVLCSYFIGGVIAGGVCLSLGFIVFYAVSGILGFIIFYDIYKLRSAIRERRQHLRNKRRKTALKRERLAVSD